MRERHAVEGARCASVELELTPAGRVVGLALPLGELEGRTVRLEDAFRGSAGG